MFGYPAGASCRRTTRCMDSPIRHMLVRHEQGAGHMAEGYAHVTGRAGVAMVTSGPAATNLVTPLMDAYMDSIPMVAITGQVPTGAIGSDAFQECDTVGITRSVTKHNELVMTAEDMPMAVRQAFHIATDRPPRPGADRRAEGLLTNEMEWHWPSDDDVLASLPGYRPNIKGHPRMIKEAARLILAAERPVHLRRRRHPEGARRRGAARTRRADRHPRRHHADGPRCVPRRPPAVPRHARHARQRHRRHGDAAQRPADRPRIAASTTASPARSTRSLPTPRSSTSTSTRPSRARSAAPTCRSSATAKYVIEEIIKAIKDLRRAARSRPTRRRLEEQGSGWREQFPMTYEQSEPGEALKPQFCIEQLSEPAPEDTIVTSGVGQHQMCTSQYWKFNEPYTWVNSGGLGTMGFSIPAAIGAKAAKPDHTVWAIDGDGCFQMTAQELVTSTVERLPIKVALLNNSYLGMVRQWQEMFYDERYSRGVPERPTCPTT